jgi:cupin superfamily acireductone dioxygenase involved in methionine salvage
MPRCPSVFSTVKMLHYEAVRFCVLISHGRLSLVAPNDDHVVMALVVDDYLAIPPNS